MANKVPLDPNPDEHLGAYLAVDEFRWPVSNAVYRWATLRDNDSPKKHQVLTCSTEVSPQGDAGEVHYSPLTISTLFLEFARLSINHDAIIAFAQKRGWLGIGKSFSLPRIRLRRCGWIEPSGFGELFSDWRAEIESMQKAVRLWHLCEDRNTVELGKIFRFETDQCGVNGPKHENPEGEWNYISPYRNVRYLRPNDVVGAAAYLTKHIINYRLDIHVAPRVTWKTESNTHRIDLRPKNLLGALWLQFAHAFTGDVRYRRCRACQNWIPFAGADGARSHREFCSPACRQTDHRIKVKQARDKHAKGASIRDLAKHFDTKPDTIKRWLTKEK